MLVFITMYMKTDLFLSECIFRSTVEF